MSVATFFNHPDRIDAFEAWCDAGSTHVLDETPISRAVKNARNHRVALRHFLDDGRLPIHNNRSERELRRVAVGRKNWLCLGSDEAGEANAVFVSLIASCQLHGLDPAEYLRETCSACYRDGRSPTCSTCLRCGGSRSSPATTSAQASQATSSAALPSATPSPTRSLRNLGPLRSRRATYHTGCRCRRDSSDGYKHAKALASATPQTLRRWSVPRKKRFLQAASEFTLPRLGQS